MTWPVALTELYHSIQPELEAVDRDLRETLRSDRPEVAEMTALAAGYGGKRMRPAVVLLVGKAAGQLSPLHARLGATVEMIHLATLVHDDVIDEASLRRQRQTVNRHWSNYDAVLLGDVLFTRSMNLLARLADQRCLLRITAAVSTLCEGEILQNQHRGDPQLSEDIYYDIIDAKTAELYASGCELSAHLAGASEDAVQAFRTMGREFGLAFQIVDDCLDLAGEEQEVGKSLGTDLRSGKMTLPMLILRDLLVEQGRADDGAQLERHIVERDGGPRRVRELMEELGTIDLAIDRAREHVRKGLAAARPFASEAMRPALDAVGTYVIDRTL